MNGTYLIETLICFRQFINIIKRFDSFNLTSCQIWIMEINLINYWKLPVFADRL